jgi:hypothetical protein
VRQVRTGCLHSLVNVPSDAAAGAKLLLGFVKADLVLVGSQKLMSRFRSVGFEYRLKKLLHLQDRLSHGLEPFKVENLS